MCVGDNLLVDCDKLAVDFKTKFNDESVLDTSLFFDFEEGRKEANYMKIVKESEKHGPGGLNPGHFLMNEKFSMTFGTQISDPADLQKLLDNIPGSDKMRKIIIQ